jgi:hypothetical protein
MPLHDQRVEHFTPEIAIATHPDKSVRDNSIFINLNMLERQELITVLITKIFIHASW